MEWDKVADVIYKIVLTLTAVLKLVQERKNHKGKHYRSHAGEGGSTLSIPPLFYHKDEKVSTAFLGLHRLRICKWRDIQADTFAHCPDL